MFSFFLQKLDVQLFCSFALGLYYFWLKGIDGKATLTVRVTHIEKRIETIIFESFLTILVAKFFFFFDQPGQLQKLDWV